MIKGYANEYKFCEIFHDKFIYQLDEKYIKFLEGIYEQKLEPKAYIICWKSDKLDKADLIIRVGRDKKYISIKSGKNNSVHLENFKSFIEFLKNNNVSNKIIETYKDYHYANDSYGNRISAIEYQEKYSQKLTELNKVFNEKELVKKAIDRFLFEGINDDKSKIDVIIYGTPSNFKYATRKQLTNYLLSQNDTFLTPHFSSLVLQPWTRNLNNNPKYEYRRNFVQVKWYRLDAVFEKIHL